MVFYLPSQSEVAGYRIVKGFDHCRAYGKHMHRLPGPSWSRSQAHDYRSTRHFDLSTEKNGQMIISIQYTVYIIQFTVYRPIYHMGHWFAEESTYLSQRIVPHTANFVSILQQSSFTKRHRGAFLYNDLPCIFFLLPFDPLFLCNGCFKVEGRTVGPYIPIYYTIYYILYTCAKVVLRLKVELLDMSVLMILVPSQSTDCLSFVMSSKDNFCAVFEST